MFDTFVKVLMRKHAGRDAIIDANLLFLWCVGVCNPELISKVKGTREYTRQDYEKLSSVLKDFRSFLVTPNIFTEVSNLTCRLAEPLRVAIHLLLQHRSSEALNGIAEQYVPITTAARQACYLRLGLTDSSIAELSTAGTLVITNDLDLSIYLESQAIDCIHYNRMLRFDKLGK